MKKIRFSRRFEEDWSFYYNNRKKFNFAGEAVPIRNYNKDGRTAKECFYLYDSTGKWEACKEPALLQQIIICKKSVNFHIKMWVDGFYDMLEGVKTYLKEFVNPPEWVGHAFRQQLDRRGITEQEAKELIIMFKNL